MADTLDLLGVIGTWLGVVIGLVAIVGVITPFLLLRAARSERSQALGKVDDAGTGYIKNRWNMTRQIRFRSVHAPLLSLLPGEGGVSLSRIVTLEQRNRAEDVVSSSSTGWVNLAKLAEFYSSGSKKGDPLLIRHGEAWFPVHRFFILGIGLRGRYGHRPDRGESRSVRTTARLFTEEGNLDDEDAYLNSGTANKLYGTTGVAWWRQSLDLTETRFDEIYFAQHPDRPRLEHLVDPTPLSELFWLSIGCLPMGDGRRVYDLDMSNRAPVVSTRPTDRQDRPRKDTLVTARPHDKENRPREHTVVTAQPTDKKDRPRKDTVAFTRRESLLERHTEWATSMGARERDIYYLEFPPGVRTNTSRVAVKEADRQHLALGILKLTLSAGGFLLPAGRNLSSFFRGSKFSEALKDPNNVDHLGDPLESLALTLTTLGEHGDVRGFSRQRAQLCAEANTLLENELSRAPAPDDLKRIQLVVSVLTITDRIFFGQISDLLRGPSPGDMISIETQADSVTIGGKIYQFDYTGIFSTQNTYPSVDLSKLCVFLCFLKACVRVVAVNNYVDSTPLLDSVNKMTTTVHVASNTHPPLLFLPGSQASGQPEQHTQATTGSAKGRESGRQTRRRARILQEGESSETASGDAVVYDDSSDDEGL
ncbi:hypothetical protein G647_07320 [Cladophialophora carrionii CBS 160.54]|uniref:Uncharacterized protein n=1 Tax=Cladophialophora carrionii CBS 160.54 TaxID=1279043 RepID=V9D4Q5_9EURO|nr:uncharacterized protein G647_07320 [Cladophialophora carrionii CBS 160.54]ETI20977.1 hypothetical protein G647_07320 [Cladophialophora carrionii CBS 160.54]